MRGGSWIKKPECQIPVDHHSKSINITECHIPIDRKIKFVKKGIRDTYTYRQGQRARRKFFLRGTLGYSFDDNTTIAITNSVCGAPLIFSI